MKRLSDQEASSHACASGQKRKDLNPNGLSFRAFQDAVWGSWLGLAGLPGRAGRAKPSGSIRGAKNIEKPCKIGQAVSGTLCFPILFGPQEREMLIFPKEMRPALRGTSSETLTYISFLSARTPSEATSVWGKTNYARSAELDCDKIKRGTLPVHRRGNLTCF